MKRKKWKDILKSGKAAKIYKLKLEAIDFADTALGRLKKENMNQMKATNKNLTKE